MGHYVNRSIVLRMIQKATEEHPNWELGKKALQKSLYFFNLKSNCFSFKWANFGPMSAEIQQIVHDLNAVKRIEINPTKKLNVTIHRISYVKKHPPLEIPPPLDKMLDATMSFVAGQSSRNLELLASVHFWAKRNDGKDEAEYVYQMLKELKPNAGFTKTDVEHALLELKNLSDAAT